MTIKRKLAENRLTMPLFDTQAFTLDIERAYAAIYERWYAPHGEPELLENAVYGLTELDRERIRGADLVANPGCYPTAAILALTPLAPYLDDVVIDAKSGVSGAGRGGSDAKFSYAECNEDVSPYGLLQHTHLPEIARTIEAIGGTSQGLVFTPHLIPMTRGILATIYCRGSVDTQACLAAAREFYAGRPFVKVIDKPLHTKWAYGSNNVFVSYACDPARKLVMAFGAIDNLGKGAAGQALQNANLMHDLPEATGLEGVALWP